MSTEAEGFEKLSHAAAVEHLRAMAEKFEQGETRAVIVLSAGLSFNGEPNVAAYIFAGDEHDPATATSRDVIALQHAYRVSVAPSLVELFGLITKRERAAAQSKP